jgi:hypothetical protein
LQISAFFRDAPVSRPPDELLDRIVGTWVLEGTIDGKATTHDGEYSCQWLDSTSNAGLSNGVVCRAKPSPDELRLQFKYADRPTSEDTPAVRLPSAGSM